MLNLSKVAIAGALLVSSLNAYQILTIKDDGVYSLKFWADDHWEKINSDNVIGVSAFDKNGKRIKAGYDYANNKIHVNDDVALSVVMYDLGYWSFTQKEHFNKPRNEVNGIIYDSRKNLKFGKSIFSWNDDFTKPVGLKLEITPLQNPLELKEGDKLKVLVTLDGKAFSDVEFEDQNDDLDVKADENGIAYIPITKANDGLSIIAAVAKLPFYTSDKLAQTLQLTCTLSFKQSK